MPKQSAMKATKAAKRSASQALASAEKAIEAARKATKKAKKADANAKKAQASALRAAQLERSSSDRKPPHSAGKQAATEKAVITKRTAQAPRKTDSAHGRSLGPPRKKAGNRKSGKKAAGKKPVSRSAVKPPGAKRSVRRERRGS